MNQTVGSPSIVGILPSFDNTAILLTGIHSAYTARAAVSPSMVETTCVASANTGKNDVIGTAAIWGTMSWDITTAGWSSWWCSNGIYKRVSSNTTLAYKANFNQ